MQVGSCLPSARALMRAALGSARHRTLLSSGHLTSMTELTSTRTVCWRWSSLREALLFFCPDKHPVAAARRAAHLPKEGAQGACMNSHAVGPRSKKKQRRPPRPQRRCRHEVPRDANPRTRPPAPPPLGRRPQAMDNPPPEDFSSRTRPRRGGPLRVTQRASQGECGGPAPTHGWHTMGQESLPQPRRAGVTIGLLPACFPGTPQGRPAAQVPPSF